MRVDLPRGQKELRIYTRFGVCVPKKSRNDESRIPKGKDRPEDYTRDFQFRASWNNTKI